MESTRREYFRVYRAQDIARRKALGCCIECSSPAITGSIRCAACGERRRTQRRRKTEAALAIGQCCTCFRVAALPNNRVCETCYLKDRAKGALGSTRHWPDLLALLEQQGRRCVYTGRPLVLGVNADVDHIVPLESGGAKSIENVQWTDSSVNYLKRAFLEADFLALVAEIARYRNL